MEWYNILAIVAGAFGGTAGIISIYKAKPERTSIEVQNMKEMLDEAHKMFNTMKEEKDTEHEAFEEYKETNMKYVSEFKARFTKLEERLDRAESIVFRLKSAIFQGYRCPFPPKVKDCPVLQAFEGDDCHACDEANNGKNS